MLADGEICIPWLLQNDPPPPKKPRAFHPDDIPWGGETEAPQMFWVKAMSHREKPELSNPIVLVYKPLHL